jgi:hypothetical protein
VESVIIIYLGAGESYTKRSMEEQYKVEETSALQYMIWFMIAHSLFGFILLNLFIFPAYRVKTAFIMYEKINFVGRIFVSIVLLASL